MKHSIAWHKDRIENMLALADSDQRMIQNHQDNLDRLKAVIAFYTYQIDEAEKANKDGFDREKWRRKIPVKLSIPCGWEEEK